MNNFEHTAHRIAEKCRFDAGEFHERSSIGYLPDPNAYKAGEYSAITVPKIIDLPPFVPTAGRELTEAAVAMLERL